MKQIGNWVNPDGSGRTIQIGKRASGKLIRIYEKGMQLGEPFHPWVRWELELHSNSHDIPWDVLIEPGRYVVGAYPNALAWVQSEMSRIVTIQRSPHRVELARIVERDCRRPIARVVVQLDLHFGDQLAHADQFRSQSPTIGKLFDALGYAPDAAKVGSLGAAGGGAYLGGRQIFGG